MISDALIKQKKSTDFSNFIFIHFIYIKSICNETNLSNKTYYNGNVIIHANNYNTVYVSTLMILIISLIIILICIFLNFV